MTLQGTQNNDRRDGDPRIELLRLLAEPVRLRVVDRLGHAGPASVTQLARELGLPMPQLSNHLRRLREAGLVDTAREGRQVIYELAEPGVERLVVALDAVTGRVAPSAADRQGGGALAPSRTCYGHLAGAVGVRLFAALCARDAIASEADGSVTLGSAAGRVLGALGVDPDAVEAGRRRYAFGCLDATEHAPHLAGALGDAVADALFERGWLRRGAGREYAVTTAGAEGLAAALGEPFAA